MSPIGWSPRVERCGWQSSIKGGFLGRHTAGSRGISSGQQCWNIRAKSLNRVGLVIEEVSEGFR